VSRSRARRIGPLLGLLMMVVTVTAGCRPLYLPPLPGDALTVEPAVRLGAESRLELVDEPAGPLLRLTLVVQEVPFDGWLAVQWFGPAGGAIASDSVWLEGGTAGATVRLDAPASLALTPGEWRALASWYGDVVRQFRTEID
jgi:hypothetical protein